MHLDATVAAIVTGGASGLGAACAQALASAGVRVALFDIDAARGVALASAIDGLFATVDVTSESSVAQGFMAARAAHGQERVLINCAGILGAARTAGRDRQSGQIRGFPMELFERVIRINLVGTFRCLTYAAQGMLSNEPSAEGERGVIVNTASIAAVEGQMGQAAYAASKAGVLGLTLPVARDLAGEGIRINTILPGVFETPMMAAAPEAVRQALEAAVPFPRRAGQPAEFAQLALELCRNPYLNGAAIRLDGGLRMAPR